MADHMHLAPRIRDEEKYFPASHADVCRSLRRAGNTEVRTEHSTEDIDGSTIFVQLRLNIACKARFVQAWSASLKLHGVRIDGVDHHDLYRAADGQQARGWHRHGWDPARQQQTERIPLDGFGHVADIETFVRRVCETLGVSLDKHDLGLFDLSEDS